MNAVRTSNQGEDTALTLDEDVEHMERAMITAINAVRWQAFVFSAISGEPRLWIRDDGMVLMQLGERDFVALFPGGHLLHSRRPFAVLGFPRSSLEDVLYALHTF